MFGLSGPHDFDCSCARCTSRRGSSRRDDAGLIAIALPDGLLLADLGNFQPFEYFCFGCGQLRLCLDVRLQGCKNCGTAFTHKGKPGELDGAQLKKQYREIS